MNITRRLHSDRFSIRFAAPNRRGEAGVTLTDLALMFTAGPVYFSKCYSLNLDVHQAVAESYLTDEEILWASNIPYQKCLMRAISSKGSWWCFRRFVGHAAGSGKECGIRAIYYGKSLNTKYWMLTSYSKSEHAPIPGTRLKQNSGLY